jgi:hypothetical protein
VIAIVMREWRSCDDDRGGAAQYARAMRRLVLALVLALVSFVPACGTSPPRAPTPAAPAAPETPAISKACTGAEHRTFDFWVGDWTLVLRARRGVASEEWDEAKATNEIRVTHAGCVIEERFHADGPGEPWSGHSVSTFADGRWRQTWVDDQGSYMLFVGGFANGAMTLEGEPKERDGKKFRMRMVFDAITPTSMTWRWERSEDEGKTWRAMMTIDYRRA